MAEINVFDHGFSRMAPNVSLLITLVQYQPITCIKTVRHVERTLGGVILFVSVHIRWRSSIFPCWVSQIVKGVTFLNNIAITLMCYNASVRNQIKTLHSRINDESSFWVVQKITSEKSFVFIFINSKISFQLWIDFLVCFYSRF